MSRAVTDLDDLDHAIAVRLGSDEFGLKVIDRLEMPESEALPRQQGHCGVWWDMPSSRNTGAAEGDRQRAWVTVQDRLLVYLFYRVKPRAQLDSRRLALAKERTVREALTRYDWESPVPARFTYIRTVNRAYVGDFYRIEQEFSVDVARSVGGRS